MPTKKVKAVKAPWEEAGEKASKKPSSKKTPVKKAAKASSKKLIRVRAFGIEIDLPFDTDKEVKTAMTILTARCSRGQPATIISGKDEYTFVPNFGVLICDA